jgi:hypothetical protein
MTASPATLHGIGMLHRVARTACPVDQRPWIDAMFAELDEIDTASRRSWMLGALAIVGSVVSMRAGLVPALVWWGIVASAHALVVLAIGSRSDFDRWGMDDDVFMRFAWVAGVLLVGLGVFAINRIFNHTDATPRRRG